MSAMRRAGDTARTAEMPNISYGSYTLLSDSAWRTLLTRKATTDQPMRRTAVLERKRERCVGRTVKKRTSW